MSESVCLHCGKPCPNAICVDCEREDAEAQVLDDGIYEAATATQPRPAAADSAREVVERHSWRSQSLVELAANPPEPPCIGGIVYQRIRGTLLSGETEALKTWLALILAKAEMDAGYPVAWVDLDAMGAGELLARLRALGVHDETVDHLFLYKEPDQALRHHLLDEVRGEITERGVRLFVVDAFNPMLSLHGLDPSSTPDVEAFWREVAAPLQAAGAGPTLLDHVVKNQDARGRYAYGSERKASGAIVHIGFRLLEPFARGKTGRALLTTHKDRRGFLRRPTLGRLVLASDGHRVSYDLESDLSTTAGGFRPTVLMQRISQALEGRTDPVSQTWIEENVSGNATSLRKAIQVLLDEGYIEDTKPAVGYGYRSLRPYRETEDEHLLHDPVHTPSNPVPKLLSTTPSPVPSYRDGTGSEAPSPSSTPSNDLDDAQAEERA